MNEPGEVHCTLSTGNEINKGERDPMSSRNRDVGFGRVAFSLLLEIELVWHEFGFVSGGHRAGVEIILAWWKRSCYMGELLREK